ncbi:MAG: hypothetical protein F6K65_07185 [Moorea sp. SIO3C2]|nr:hypothetical protein [Moorena sp. SIO3C2]
MMESTDFINQNPIEPILVKMPGEDGSTGSTIEQSMPKEVAIEHGVNTLVNIEHGVNTLVNDVVDQALVQVESNQELQVVREKVATVMGDTLKEIAAEHPQCQSPLATGVSPMNTNINNINNSAVECGISGAKQVQELGFTEFTAGLINSTFDAIMGATIKQMEAYRELVANLAKTLAQFQAENVCDVHITDHLAQHYSDGQGGTVVRPNYTFKTIPADPNTGTQEKPANYFLREVAQALEAETINLTNPLILTIQENQERFFTSQVQAIRSKIGELLATNMIENLRAIAREGMARIVVTDGEILSKLTFNVTATEQETTGTNQYQRQHECQEAMQRGLGGFHGAYKVRTQVPHTAPPHERLHQDANPYIRGRAVVGLGNVSAGTSHNKLTVKPVNESSLDALTMSTDIIGQVKIRFRTETFPPVDRNG